MQSVIQILGSLRTALAVEKSRTARLEQDVARLTRELQEADDDTDEYLRQLKLSMHANMRKRKQLRLQDALRRSLPVPRVQRAADYRFIPAVCTALNTDRAMLEATMNDLNVSSWECPRCGHSEECSTMDAAYALRDYLLVNAAPPPAPAAESASPLLNNRSTNQPR